MSTAYKRHGLPRTGSRLYKVYVYSTMVHKRRATIADPGASPSSSDPEPSTPGSRRGQETLSVQASFVDGSVLAPGKHPEELKDGIEDRGGLTEDDGEMPMS